MFRSLAASIRRLSSASMDCKVLVTRPLNAAALRPLESLCRAVDVHDVDSPMPYEDIKKRIVGASALLCLLTDKIDAQVLDAAGPQLKYISTLSVGYDHIDIAECKRRGIQVGNTPGVLTDATADIAVTLLLMTARRALEAATAVKSGAWGAWSPTWMCGKSVSGSTVGIVGLGRIGQAVAQRLRGFGIGRLLYSGRSNAGKIADELHAEYVSQTDLLKQSDFVILTCALTPETKGLINKNTLALMKPTAILVNTSRGPVVDQDALFDSLSTGGIYGAGLDVTTPEPLSPSHPLLTLPNCVILPHIGSANEDTRAKMLEIAVANLVNGMQGNPMVAPV